MFDRDPRRLSFAFLLCCLTFIGFIIRLYMARVDPFLHIWDERFHALVSLNMMDHPFKPILRINPLFTPDPSHWTQASLWLHKQPLFMWQMALSMKLFGTNVYAIRYPSIIMGTLMIPMVYSIVKNLSNDKLIALLTAVLFCFSNFHLELVAGIRSMDHNDLTLEFYVLASVWAWVKYEKTKKWYWVILIGVLSGAAILTKWLIGLFIYLIWAIKIILRFKERFNIKEVVRFMSSLVVCCLIFIPWQLFIIKNYPVEAFIEYRFNSRHITEALEGHEGNIFFYLVRFPQMFGEGMFLLIFPGIYLWYKSSAKDANTSTAMLLGCTFVFFFFSIIVKTKVISHMYFIAPFLMMLLAYTIVYICSKWLKRTTLIVVFLLGLFVLNMKPEKIILDQSIHNDDRNNNIYNAQLYKKLSKKIPKGSFVVNIPDCISFMFFNKGVTAYETFSEEQVKELESRKVVIIAFDNVRNHPLPDYIKSYPFVHLLHDEIR